ncbi:SDR family NAD(P)-dependent oxidoreductase [Luteolibacter pohnpeiensis]|uniref:SDR family NAD(P)-dependent oxidoreductase n=1 Tax=Luteolibacter pohnpeiensis TaxID=454153 RepID=A0A934S9V6_9BACT|nr:SDR family NAD(P)-dependent oxidoreductase [Luteolibacter pohnpeiensis]MBK1882312.1 SDR family NAD(P)-dependent oxidoreductase [Luteolibacter pohnpeiensis]
MDKTLKVLITGGSSGIGLAIATQLVQAGADVVSLSRSGSKKPNVGVRQVRCDITDKKETHNVVEELRANGWIPDVLINNAGIALGAPHAFWEQPIDDIHQVIGVNVLGVVNATHAVLRSMWIPNGKGTIVNVSSVTGLEVPIKGMGEVSYHSSKAFLEGFSNALRNEMLGTDIRVLAVRPGFVRTNFHFDRVGRKDDKFEKVFEGMTPLSADDVADAVVWAISKPERISIKALDIVPTPQRSLTQNDREWNARHPL